MDFGGVLGTIGTLGGAFLGQSAMGNAAGIQNSFYNQAIQQLMQGKQGATAAFQPYQQAGQSAIAQLLAPGGIQMSPEYQSIMQTGMQNINAQSAARGQYFSPATVQALGQYGMSEASQYQSKTLHDLLSQAGLGLQGAGGIAQAQTGGSSSIANMLLGQGQMQAQSTMGQSAGLSQLFGLVGGAAGSMFGGPLGGMLGGSLGGLFGGGTSGGGGGSTASSLGNMGLSSPYGYATR